MAGTLADMKDRITDELDRDDLSDQVENAIRDAIALYQPTRFYFNETGAEGSNFVTQAGKVTYGATDDPDIPFFYDIDEIFVTISNNNYRVRRIDPSFWRIQQLPTMRGQPYQYMWANQTISLFPTPNTAYAMTITGHYKIAAPASDTEPNNHWMTDAEGLIRNCAKRLLFTDLVRNYEAAEVAGAREREHLDQLKRVTSGMIRNTRIEAMDF